MSPEHADHIARLPEPGEEIDLETGDTPHVYEPMTLRVRCLTPIGHGYINVTGWRVDPHGMPGEEVGLNILVSQLEYRRRQTQYARRHR